MNDSKYGLTASVWTDAKNPASVEAFERLADDIEGAFAQREMLVPCSRQLILEPHCFSRHCFPQPVRLPRPRARMDRRQGQRPWRLAQLVRCVAPPVSSEEGSR